LACSDDGYVTGEANHEILRAALLWINQLQKIRFWIERTAGKTPDREDNALLLMQIEAIRRAPLVEFQTDIQPGSIFRIWQHDAPHSK
jgi:hypothetical protein